MRQVLVWTSLCVCLWAAGSASGGERAIFTYTDSGEKRLLCASDWPGLGRANRRRRPVLVRRNRGVTAARLISLTRAVEGSAFGSWTSDPNGQPTKKPTGNRRRCGQARGFCQQTCGPSWRLGLDPVRQGHRGTCSVFTTAWASNSPLKASGPQCSVERGIPQLGCQSGDGAFVRRPAFPKLSRRF